MFYRRKGIMVMLLGAQIYVPIIGNVIGHTKNLILVSKG